MRRWLPLPFVLWCVWQTAHYIPVWRSELTLTSHTATMAPFKPRVAMNRAGALLRDGQTQAGLSWLAWAYHVAGWPHVPAFDRQITRETVALNLERMR